jgi:outer membrane protein assembly factor BamE (lipoprotein component of BamABCDE complex)
MKASLHAAAAVAALCLLAACTNEGQIYAKKHPELNPVQRRILATGIIPDGAAVAGLTRDQIRMAMGTDPYTFDRVGDEDTWVFSHKKAVARDPVFANSPADSVLDKAHGYTETETDQNTPRVDVDVKTTVYFEGNIATHAHTIEEKAQ